jgi:hypothetical protein
VLCKLDIEKVYDHVNWFSLAYVEEMRFWEQMTYLDSIFYFLGALFCIGQ